ncbi:HTK16 [Symbiodinium microadriaticum]|nr:HTK16 [Symbiodinium microadriaticum]
MVSLSFATQYLILQCVAGRPDAKEAPAAARRPGVPAARDFPPLPGLPPLPLEGLSIGVEIGKGRFKHVNRGVLKGSAVPDEDEADRDIVVIRYAKGKPECTLELQVLSRLALVPDAGDHIPKVWGACEQGRDLIVVQERAAFGCLKAVVQEGLGADHGLRAAVQIAAGMDCLQRARVVHADLSCRNILVSALGKDPDSIRVKVTDFGLSAIIKEGMDHEIRKQPQATRWVSPETCAYQKLSHRGDVWSTGTLLWELFSDGQIPWVNWPKRTEVATKLKAMAENPEEAFDAAAEFPEQEKYPKEAHTVLLSCLKVAEADRPAFLDLAEEFEKVIRLQADRAAAPAAPAQPTSAPASAKASQVLEPLLAETSEPEPPREASLPQWSQMSEAQAERSPSPSSRTPSTQASPAKTLLGRETDAGGAQKWTGKGVVQEEVITLISQQKEMLELLHAELTELRQSRRISHSKTPLREMLIPLTDDGAPIKPAHMELMAGRPGTWTLRTLVGPGLMRKQEFEDKEEAWQAFVYCADTVQPCHLLDPSGNTRASSGWVGANQVARAQAAMSPPPRYSLPMGATTPPPPLAPAPLGSLAGLGPALQATAPLGAPLGGLPTEPRVRFLC